MDVSTPRRAVVHGWTKRLALLLSFCLVTCGKPEEEIDPTDPPEWAIAKFVEASARLLKDHLEGPFVVTRTPAGAPEHQGEGILWAGVAMASLSCEDGTRIEDGLIEMITRHGGALVRFEPLGEYAGGREITLDGALGLYRGIAERVERCQTGEKWKPALALHKGFLDANGGRLHANTSADLDGGFDYVLGRLLYRVGLRDRPDNRGLHRLIRNLTLWTAAVVQTKAAGYRINLSVLAMETVEATGQGIPSEGRLQFCEAAKGAGMRYVEHYCGREHLATWIHGYEYNRFEFEFQRARWESPDGDSDITPGLDLLYAIRKAYKL